ncbi:hypothetical protein CcrMagneto_gp341 [Caulobacter virus Magneto]|uniref:hypothetical protein n=1 Tax=Caulobacter virus Magneto TaxID=1211642 RepID=UPI00028B03C3|nr:hypothetical protein CcrMagneto_gp013 [Caulobacter virus Magneto]YP_006989023.1 hypothetical protein CcrMagneto_gp341 [Caulobacter virus Magneto]AFU87183.1 hypothetical protein CcrMagneto_gp013 [Caulobacter virus Magneto]AFU87511.1 hypothetical protein CcrMagneto_gp341 [Caulobacter virus Magneto]
MTARKPLTKEQKARRRATRRAARLNWSDERRAREFERQARFFLMIATHAQGAGQGQEAARLATVAQRKVTNWRMAQACARINALAAHPFAAVVA